MFFILYIQDFLFLFFNFNFSFMFCKTRDYAAHVCDLLLDICDKSNISLFFSMEYLDCIEHIRA